MDNDLLPCRSDFSVGVVSVLYQKAHTLEHPERQGRLLPPYCVRVHHAGRWDVSRACESTGTWSIRDRGSEVAAAGRGSGSRLKIGKLVREVNQK